MKEPFQAPSLPYNKYQLIRDWYTLDTFFVNRAILWQDTMSRAKDKLAIDTMPDKWYIMCASLQNPIHLEHWYYTRNGKKINFSKYPLNK